LFIHITVDPTEIVTAFGANASLVIVTVAVVGVGDAGMLLDPHALAAVSHSSAAVILIHTRMIHSFLTVHHARPLPAT